MPPLAKPARIAPCQRSTHSYAAPLSCPKGAASYPGCTFFQWHVGTSVHPARHITHSVHDLPAKPGRAPPGASRRSRVPPRNHSSTVVRHSARPAALTQRVLMVHASQPPFLCANPPHKTPPKFTEYYLLPWGRIACNIWTIPGYCWRCANGAGGHLRPGLGAPGIRNGAARRWPLTKPKQCCSMRERWFLLQPRHRGILQPPTCQPGTRETGSQPPYDRRSTAGRAARRSRQAPHKTHAQLQAHSIPARGAPAEGPPRDTGAEFIWPLGSRPRAVRDARPAPRPACACRG
jgi:hypothetical protein